MEFLVFTATNTTTQMHLALLGRNEICTQKPVHLYSQWSMSSDYCFCSCSCNIILWLSRTWCAYVHVHECLWMHHLFYVPVLKLLHTSTCGLTFGLSDRRAMVYALFPIFVCVPHAKYLFLERANFLMQFFFRKWNCLSVCVPAFPITHVLWNR